VDGEVIINNETGLHARPASILVNKAKSYEANIELILGDKKVNGKSILGVMSLGAKKGARLIIRANGVDEKKAVEELVLFIQRGLKD